VSVLPADFVWHQSSVAMLLACPERFRRRHVFGAPADHRATDYAAPLGTADHAGLEHVLRHAAAGTSVDRDALRDVVLGAFDDAVARATERGASPDPDGVGRALERLGRLLALAADPRLRAVDWRGIEWRFELTEREGRRWRGTIDAWGVAQADARGFGALGREPVDLRRGEGVIVDWKTGEPPPFGPVERARQVQLGLYAMALAHGRPDIEQVPRWRTFVGALRDLDRPKAPTDGTGRRIPKRLPKELNPIFVAAHDGDEAAARASKRRPRDAAGAPVPKWLPERLNPAWEAACARPRGPVFREARVDYELVLATVRAAVRQAELGLFPASGALTDQCRRCAYAPTCTQPEEENHHDHPDADA
jgi:hypothetical protein